ncbi:MAG: hypothetical protein HY671_08200 [Chloroflexi bacterium]|nr:hypothetical protein [Chloroflexota bacterium]
MHSRFFELNGKRFVTVSANGAGGRNAKEQGELTLARLRDGLDGAKSRFENLLRITVYMKGREVADPMRQVRGQAFRSDARPASSSIFVERLQPEGALVEIEGTALASDRQVSKRAIEFSPPRPYIKAMVAERYAFLSGTGGEGQTEAEQAKSCFKTMDAYLKELGGSLLDVCHIAVYLKRMEAMEDVSREVHRVFTKSQPCWEVTPAAGFAREDMLLEIEGTAVLGLR